jgi:hypothetical protein
MVAQNHSGEFVHTIEKKRKVYAFQQSYWEPPKAAAQSYAHHKLARKNADLITCYVTKPMCNNMRHAQLPAGLCHTRPKCLLVAIKLLQQLLMLLLKRRC